VDDNAEGKAEHVKCHIKPDPIMKLNESDRKMGDRKISGGVLGPVSWFVAGEWGAGVEVPPWCVPSERGDNLLQAAVAAH
jgi:hypothetical protein